MCARFEKNIATWPRQLGAVWVGEASDMPSETLHSAIMFAPAGELVPPALRALEKGGTLALAGIYMTPIPSLDYTLDLFQERTLAKCDG